MMYSEFLKDINGNHLMIDKFTAYIVIIILINRKYFRKVSMQY